MGFSVKPSTRYILESRLKGQAERTWVGCKQVIHIISRMEKVLSEKAYLRRKLYQEKNIRKKTKKSSYEKARLSKIPLYYNSSTWNLHKAIGNNYREIIYLPRLHHIASIIKPEKKFWREGCKGWRMRKRGTGVSSKCWYFQQVVYSQAPLLTSVIKALSTVNDLSPMYFLLSFLPSPSSPYLLHLLFPIHPFVHPLLLYLLPANRTTTPIATKACCVH